MQLYVGDTSGNTSHFLLMQLIKEHLNYAINTTAHKVNHLQPVPPVQRSLAPTGTRHNLPIMLNRHPVPLQPKFTNELFKTGRLRKRIEVAGLAVENHSE
jgi:hypothetical protein